MTVALQKESQIFPPTTGGAAKMAADMRVPFLGKVPLDPRIGRCCDEGKSFLSEIPESPAAEAYKQIIQSEYKAVKNVKPLEFMTLVRWGSF